MLHKNRVSYFVLILLHSVHWDQLISITIRGLGDLDLEKQVRSLNLLLQENVPR